MAAAHIQLDYPPARSTDQKARPCGVSGSTRGTPMVLEPNTPLTVMWRETVNHPGHFRISLDMDGQDFTFPPDATSDTALTDPLVIQDLIPDVNGGPTSFTFMLPDIECDNCTLQVIQLMTDKPPYTVDANSNDLYFQCADITLARGGGSGDGGDGDDMTDDGTTDDTSDDTTDNTDDADGTTPTDVDGGCSTDGGASALAMLAVVGLVAKKRRGLRRA
jgi:hypothetical protein